MALALLLLHLPRRGPQATEFLILRSSARSGFHHGLDHLVMRRFGVTLWIAVSVVWSRCVNSSSELTVIVWGRWFFTSGYSVLFQLKPWNVGVGLFPRGERVKVMGTWSSVLWSSRVVHPGNLQVVG